MSNWNGTGHFNYKNRYVMQNNLAFDLLTKLYKEYNFDNIIEIGTANGGLTLFLRDLNTSDALTIYSYDIRLPTYYAPEIFKDINLITRDALCSDSLREIQKVIANAKRTLVLCDGGNKNLEFNVLAPLIKSGDFIMTHDYAPTKEYFENEINGKYWSWHESWDDGMRTGLQFVKKYKEIDFSKAVWSCFYKE